MRVTDSATSLRLENRRLRALLDFSHEVTSQRDFRTQLRLLCGELRRATGCPASAVILKDPEREAIDAIETLGLPIDVEANWQAAIRDASSPLEGHVAAPDGFVPAA